MILDNVNQDEEIPYQLYIIKTVIFRTTRQKYNFNKL